MLMPAQRPASIWKGGLSPEVHPRRVLTVLLGDLDLASGFLDVLSKLGVREVGDLVGVHGTQRKRPRSPTQARRVHQVRGLAGCRYALRGAVSVSPVPSFAM